MASSSSPPRQKKPPLTGVKIDDWESINLIGILRPRKLHLQLQVSFPPRKNARSLKHALALSYSSSEPSTPIVMGSMIILIIRFCVTS